MALDREGLARHLRRNAVTPTDHFVPPSMLGKEDVAPVPQRLDEARQFLAEAGYPGGEGIGPIALSTTSDYVDMCAAFQHDWAKLGLDVQVDVVPASVHRERVAQGEVAMFYKSWLADTPMRRTFWGFLRRLILLLADRTTPITSGLSLSKDSKTRWPSRTDRPNAGTCTWRWTAWSMQTCPSFLCFTTK